MMTYQSIKLQQNKTVNLSLGYKAFQVHLSTISVLLLLISFIRSQTLALEI
jgi:hypothetical protein